MKKFYAVLILPLILTSCATMLDPKDKASVYKQVTFNEDKFNKSRTYTGPIITLKAMKGLDTSFMDGSLSRIKSNSSETYCLNIEYQDSEWAFFNQAIDNNGNKFRLIEINQKVGTFVNQTNIMEKHCILMDRKYLDSMRLLGINMKVYGKNRNIEFILPSYYIDGFLDVSDMVEKNKYNK